MPKEDLEQKISLLIEKLRSGNRSQKILRELEQLRALRVQQAQ